MGLSGILKNPSVKKDNPPDIVMGIEKANSRSSRVKTEGDIRTRRITGSL